MGRGRGVSYTMISMINSVTRRCCIAVILLYQEYDGVLFDASIPQQFQETGCYECIPNRKEYMGGGQLYVARMV